ncbi:hypothetical protein DRQ53_12850, partial [bacterium]
HNVMVSGYGDINGSDYAATATRADRNSVISYLPTPRTVTIAMNRVEGSEADAWWIDPAEGSGQYIGRYATSGTRDFSTPGPGDWVLVIDNAAANLIDPWVGSTNVSDTPANSRVQVLSASPNPFNPRTVLSFVAPAGEHLQVAVYDARGRLLERIFDAAATGEVQTLTWEPHGLASGTYFVRASSGGQTSVRKVGLLK